MDIQEQPDAGLSTRQLERDPDYDPPLDLPDTLTVEQHARAVRRCISNMEVWSQWVIATKRELDRLEREVRQGIEGRNQQERDDQLAHALEYDKRYGDMRLLLDGYRTRRAAAEGDLEYHRLMARYKIALVAAQGAM